MALGSVRDQCILATKTATKTKKEAATHVNESLQRLKTDKIDLYGRYVAHVFYAFSNQGIEKTFLKGRYLNQELIDKGHAKPV